MNDSGHSAQIAALEERYSSATITDFGDSEALSRELLRLIRSGGKTATCAALRDYEAQGEPLPEVGGVQIVLDFGGAPIFVLQTKWVDTVRFSDVTWEFVRDEGENDTLEGWRRDHADFFARNGGFDESMWLVCERFCMLEDLASDTNTEA